jgi:hypothetical protein
MLPVEGTEMAFRTVSAETAAVANTAEVETVPAATALAELPREPIVPALDQLEMETVAELAMVRVLPAAARLAAPTTTNPNTAM